MFQRKSFSIFLLIFIGFFSSCQHHSPEELVDISELDPTIIIDLKYATSDNFVGKVLYNEKRAVLRRCTAERLVRVQHKLRQQGVGIKIWDAYRPLSVQKEMWKLVPDSRYVANPARGSRHNRGAAVDVTLVDSTGKELTMPTGFDDFTEKAGAYYQDIPAEAKRNRKILQKAMTSEGFLILDSEWWHFDDPEWKKFDILDTPLSEIK